MQTTLRIKDELYREAKAEAARQGVTVTRFIEEALRLRLERRPTSVGAVNLPTFDSGRSFDFDPAELKGMMRDSEAAHDLAKLGG